VGPLACVQRDSEPFVSCLVSGLFLPCSTYQRVHSSRRALQDKHVARHSFQYCNLERLLPREHVAAR
jgi:hypothetical protein